jgi:serine/threonine-protein kinase
VLEFVEGVGLKRLIARRESAIQERVGSIVFQLCRALRLVHKRNYVFRDFCSDNVIVDRTGALTVIDLGFVAPVGIAFEERSGTPSYMAPEQIRAEPLGFEADIYALGVIIFELLTGELPYVSRIAGDDPESARRRRLEVMRMHLDSPVPGLPEPVRTGIPVLGEVMTRCLQKNPQDRFHSAEEVMAALV